MHFQFDMSARSFPQVEAPPANSETEALLRQLVELEREQLAGLKALVGVHDGTARWRAFLARWRQDFPELSEACRQALPVLERTYGKLIAELTEQLGSNDPLLDALVREHPDMAVKVWNPK